MKRLTPKQFDRLSDKIFELTNIAAGALIFGQFIAQAFNWYLFILGALILVFGYLLAILLTRKYE